MVIQTRLLEFGFERNLIQLAFKLIIFNITLFQPNWTIKIWIQNL
jgi:hypothetical protein